MGVSASASISIVKDGVLWGLIACHNKTPRLLSYDVRAACISLAGTLSQQINSKNEVERYSQRLRLNSFEVSVASLLSFEGSLETLLPDQLDQISQMMSANGVALLRANEVIVGGVCPNKNDIRRLASWLLTLEHETVFATGQLSLFLSARESLSGSR